MKKMMLRVLYVAFILTIAGCRSHTKIVETDEEMITLTITPQYASNITDEWLDANSGIYYQSYERQSDNYIVLKMATEQYTDYVDYIRSLIISAAQNLVANNHNHITDISYNDNFSEFRVTVSTDTLYRSDADLAFFMFTEYGRFYQYLTNYQYLTTGVEAGVEDCSVAIIYLDADGIILEDDYKPE